MSLEKKDDRGSALHDGRWMELIYYGAGLERRRCLHAVGATVARLFFFDFWRHVIVLFCMQHIYESGLRGEPHQKETAVQSLVFWQRKRRLNWHTKWNTRVKMSMSAFGTLADISKKKKKKERNKAAS